MWMQKRNRRKRNEERGGRENYIISRSEKNLKPHHLSSRQLHRKDGRIKYPKLNQIPKSTQDMVWGYMANLSSLPTTEFLIKT